MTSTVGFISNQTIFKVKTEKPKTEKIRGIQGFKVVHTVNFLANDLRLWGLRLMLGGHNLWILEEFEIQQEDVSLLAESPALRRDMKRYIGVQE